MSALLDSRPRRPGLAEPAVSHCLLMGVGLRQRPRHLEEPGPEGVEEPRLSLRQPRLSLQLAGLPWLAGPPPPPSRFPKLRLGDHLVWVPRISEDPQAV